MGKILLVDDETSILRTLSTLIQGLGHSVECVNTGMAAQDQILTGSYDLVLTDIRMAPMDGIHLIKWIRATVPDLKILVVSALTSEQIIEHAMQLGADEYIKKPFKIEVVLDAIKRILG